MNLDEVEYYGALQDLLRRGINRYTSGPTTEAISRLSRAYRTTPRRGTTKDEIVYHLKRGEAGYLLEHGVPLYDILYEEAVVGNSNAFEQLKDSLGRLTSQQTRNITTYIYKYDNLTTFLLLRGLRRYPYKYEDEVFDAICWKSTKISTYLSNLADW